MSSALYRVIGKRPRPEADPIELHRFVKGTAPNSYERAEQFVTGAWRQREDGGGMSVSALIAEIQRGLRVDMPDDPWASPTQFSRIVSAAVHYHPDIAKAVNADRSKLVPDSWLPVVGTTEMILSTMTQFTIGSHSWWLVERARIVPYSTAPAVEGGLVNAVQRAVYAVEPAAKKAFRQFVVGNESDGLLGGILPARGREIGTYGNEAIATRLASDWKAGHAEEERRLAEQREREAAEQRALEEQRAREEAERAERERRIAAGDVTVLDDRSLAARLRAKRAKGMA